MAFECILLLLSTPMPIPQPHNRRLAPWHWHVLSPTDSTDIRTVIETCSIPAAGSENTTSSQFIVPAPCRRTLTSTNADDPRPAADGIETDR